MFVPKRLLGGVALFALAVGACSSGASPTPTVAPTAPPTQSQPTTAPTPTPAPPTTAPTPTPAPQVTVTWWHIATQDPGKKIWQDAADAYVAKHPNVTVKITIYENEAFKAKIKTEMQAGNAPDIFQSWGGGGMGEQADAGMLKDITADIAPWKSEINEGALTMYNYKGKQYGVPFDLGMVGWWYNTQRFTEAGITAPPTTWDELLADVSKIKAKGAVSPIAIAGKDKWPGMHMWTYLSLRIGGKDAMNEALATGKWDTDPFIKAGEQVKRLADLKPFQPGFLTAVYDKGEAACVGNDKCAMEEMGQWAPGVQEANSVSKKGITDKLGFFPFPAVAGGAGDPNDVVGGGNGWAVGKNAGPDALDFLHYISSKEVLDKQGASNQGILPTTTASEESVTAPIFKQLLGYRAKSKYVLLYLDQLTKPALGTAINDATSYLFAGTKTPQEVCKMITDAAAAA